MIDRVFVGRDVASAVAVAGQALGLSPERLRYIVLEPGQAGGLGLSATPARIAVLGDSPVVATTASMPPPSVPREELDAREDATLPLVQALSSALGRNLEAEYHTGHGVRRLRLNGPGCEALFDPEGRTLRALEHILSRIGRDADEAGLRLDCSGYREYRDRWLSQQARELADAVLADGVARETGALNAYERRLVHMAIAERPGLRTYSQGEGHDRRVTVALAEDATSGQ